MIPSIFVLRKALQEITCSKESSLDFVEKTNESLFFIVTNKQMHREDRYHLMRLTRTEECVYKTTTRAELIDRR